MTDLISSSYTDSHLFQSLSIHNLTQAPFICTTEFYPPNFVIPADFDFTPNFNIDISTPRYSTKPTKHRMSKFQIFLLVQQYFEIDRRCCCILDFLRYTRYALLCKRNILNARQFDTERWIAIFSTFTSETPGIYGGIIIIWFIIGQRHDGVGIVLYIRRVASLKLVNKHEHERVSLPTTNFWLAV